MRSALFKKYFYYIVLLFLSLTLLNSAYADNNSQGFFEQVKAAFVKKTQKDDGRIPIVVWHSFGGSLGAALRKIVKEFNESQHQYRVVAVNKSNYQNSLTSAATAFRSGTQPNIILTWEVGTAMMLHSAGAVIPLYKLLAMTGVKVNTDDFWPAVAGYYSVDGKLAGFPFNSSSPVLFYNKDALAKAGFSHPPKTWQALNAFAKSMQVSGQSCVFTTGYPSWILMDEFSAWNNLTYASDNNGFDSLKPTLEFNNTKMVAYLSQLYQWSEKGIFVYGGRLGSSDSLFTSGRCAMTMQSSSMLADFQKLKNFKVGVAPIPYWQVKDNSTPQNTIIGGGAYWTFKLPENTQEKAKIYKGVALFYKFLSTPKIQAQWASNTGYIPATKSAYELLTKQGFYKKNPMAKVSLASLNNKAPKPYTKGIRLGNFPLIRQENDSALELIFSGDNAQKTLDGAVKEGNKLIQQFYQQNRQ